MITAEDWRKWRETHPDKPLTITAKESVASIKEFQRTEQEKWRSLPRKVFVYGDISDERDIWIYNVGPWPYTATLGSWGTHGVPECHFGTPYVRMAPVPGVFQEPITYDDRRWDLNLIDGMNIAAEIVGTAKFHPSPAARLGIFIGFNRGENAAPLPNELETASTLLLAECERIFGEAQTFWNPTKAEMDNFLVSMGYDPRLQSKSEYAELPRSPEWDLRAMRQNIGSSHRFAARYLGRTDVEWMK